MPGVSIPHAPFRRVEHVDTPQKPILIESRCPYCAFVAASVKQRILAFAESTHHCNGVQEYRRMHPRVA